MLILLFVASVSHLRHTELIPTLEGRVCSGKALVGPAWRLRGSGSLLSVAMAPWVSY